jgi:hypothetical protein
MSYFIPTYNALKKTKLGAVVFAGLLTIRIFAQEPAPSPAADSSALTGAGPVVRFVNLLSYQDEASVLLDKVIVVNNTATGEISPLAPIAPGPHHVQVIPRHGKGELLAGDFIVRSGMSASIVLTGGPPSFPQTSEVASSSVPATAAMLIPIITPLQPPDRPRPPSIDGKAPAPTCSLIVANCDMRGNLAARLTAVDQSRTLELKPGAAEALTDWPVAPLGLQVTMQFKVSTGANVTPQVNLFSPTKSGTYICFLYGIGTDSVNAIYLSATGDGNLGQSSDDVR